MPKRKRSERIETITRDIESTIGERWRHDLDEVVEAFEEAYQGLYHSRGAFAEKLAEDIGVQVPDTWPLNCIDWEAAALYKQKIC